jgi:N-methylhydantoinase B/oxoprolinase/acetone carboxylase alpha subunit
MEELLNYGERKMRSGIRAIQNGEYSFCDYLDDDGIHIGKPVPIQLKLMVKDDSIALDFTGTAPQVSGAVNVVYNALKATVYYSLKTKNGRFFVYPESLGGGFGARYNKDGLDGVHVHITNSSNLPIECMEAEYPIMAMFVNQKVSQALA